LLAVLFRTVREYLGHCKRHLLEVGAKDCPDYEFRALDFLTRPPQPSLHECKRSKGDIVRYDSTTDEFGIFSFDGFIRTYMKPTIAWHKLPSNMDYFKHECARY
jgi:filamentous hemagglutinin